MLTSNVFVPLLRIPQFAGKLERWLGVSRPRESQFYLSRRAGTAPEDLRIAVGQLEQPEYVAVYAANHRSDLEALKKNDMPYQVMGDMVLYYMFHAPLGDGRYYQAEVTNKHLASWKMRKSDFHNFVLEHSLVSMESKIYPLCEKIENVLEGIS